MLVASYVCYGWWDWRFLSLIWGSTIVDFMAGRAIHATDDTRLRRLWLCLSLGTNLGMLGFFKYAGFFGEGYLSTRGTWRRAEKDATATSRPSGFV